ncbi:MAG: hypothetical protein GY706_15905 [Bacteroides sp.]|nr:hypothetical protein [Bacteroides sp.]
MAGMVVILCGAMRGILEISLAIGAIMIYEGQALICAYKILLVSLLCPAIWLLVAFLIGDGNPPKYRMLFTLIFIGHAYVVLEPIRYGLTNSWVSLALMADAAASGFFWFIMMTTDRPFCEA